MLVLLDRERFDDLFYFDPARLNQPFALQFRLINPGQRIGLDDRDFLPRRDFKFFDLALIFDAPRLDFHARHDALGFKRFRGLDRAMLVIFLPIDLEQSNLGQAVNPLGIDELILGYADALCLLLGSDLCIADADRRAGTVLFDGSVLCGATRLYVARLVDARVFEITIDFDGALFGLVILELDVQPSVVLDAVSELAALFDFLGQLRQPFSIKGVVRIEDRYVGLVQAGQRGVFEL